MAPKRPAARITKSLDTLRAQANKFAPKRNKASDGWLGDSKHSMRKSDHNPEPDGTVDAFDLTHDPANGIVIADVAEAIAESKDKRVSYMICNGRIMSGNNGPSPWVWRKYNGANGHFRHLHISVLDKHQDDTAPWSLGFGEITKPAPTPVPTRSGIDPVLREGAEGAAVERLQRALGITVDGDFGPKTRDAVEVFQRARNLVADGVVGKATWAALKA